MISPKPEVNRHTWAEEVLLSIKKLFRPAARFFSRHGRKMNVFAIFVFIAFLSWHGYGYYYAKDFDLLAGPNGSIGQEYANLMADWKGNGVTRLGGRRGMHRLRPIETNGHEENRERLADDWSGEKIGFTYDGFGDSTNVRILLPLEDTFLHIICSKQFVKRLGDNCDCASPSEQVAAVLNGLQRKESNNGTAVPQPSEADKNLPDGGNDNIESINEVPSDDVESGTAGGGKLNIAPPSTYLDVGQDYEIRKLGMFEIAFLLNYNAVKRVGNKSVGQQSMGNQGDSHDNDLPLPVVVLGPPKSGTREIAEIILDHFGISPETYDEYNLSDWKTVPNVIRKGDVDLVFHLGPRNSPIVTQIARDDTAFIVDLGDDADAIAAATEKPIRAETFVAHQYGRNINYPLAIPLFLTIPMNPPQRKHWMIAVPDETFCCNTKVLCVRKVLACSKWMSTNDAIAIATTARNSLSERLPMARWSNIKTGHEEEVQYSFMIHPGAKLLKENNSPSTWVGVFEKIWPALVIPLLIAGITFASRKANANWAMDNDDAVEDERDAKETLGSSISEVQISSPQRFGEFEGLIRHLEKDIKLEPWGIGKRKHDDLRNKITRVDQMLQDASINGDVSKEESESLSVGIRELEESLSQRSSAPPKNPIPKRASDG